MIARAGCADGACTPQPCEVHILNSVHDLGRCGALDHTLPEEAFAA